MQCSACRAVFSQELDSCPRCQAQLSPASNGAHAHDAPRAGKAAATSDENHLAATNESLSTGEAAQPSRLVEFPGTGRANHPQWRKDLSERVRQIQERRAREATRGPESQPTRPRTAVVTSSGVTVDQAKGHPLGLVPSVEMPTNPLVIAALKRIERARQPSNNGHGRPRANGGAATAVARALEENYQPEPQLPPVAAPPAEPEIQATEELPVVDHPASPPATTTTTPEPTPPRPLNLVVIAPKSQPAVEAKPVEVPALRPEPAKQEIVAAVAAAPEEVLPKKATVAAPPPTAATPPPIPAPVVAETAPAEPPPVAPAPASAGRTPRRVFEGVVDDAMLARREAEKVTGSLVAEQPLFEGADDRASLQARIVAGLIDLLIITFAASPFAAVIELTNGNWSDVRVLASMAGIYVVLMFLYLCVATLLAGRTWGMSMVSVHPADVRNGLAPSTKQAVLRALIYMISLGAGGLGLLYALFDPEGRAAHDHLSGTVVLHD